MKIISIEENTGSGAVPRNVGLNFARGEYIFFADADDLILDTALETLYNYAEKYRADVVGMERAFNCDEEPVPKDFTAEPCFIPPHLLTNVPTLETGDLAERVEKFLKCSFAHPPWLKFLRRKFLVDNEIKFPHMTISEDLIWTFEIICHAENFLRVPETLYVYRQNNISMIGRKRTPADEIKFWMNPLINGLDVLDEFMNGFELFNQANNLRVRVLNFFAETQFDFMAETFKALDANEVYKIFLREFSSAKSPNAALIAYLLVKTNLYRNGLSK